MFANSNNLRLGKKLMASFASLALAIAISANCSHAADSGDIISILMKKGILTEEEVKEIKKSENKKLKGNFKSGHKWDTGDKTGKIQIGGRVHGDINIFEGGHTKNTSIFLRRARIFAAGKLFDYYTWKVQADYASGTVSAKDLWINMDLDPRFQIKIGQYKEPFSLEQNTSSKYIDFKERATISSRIAPDRDIGIMLHGLFADKTLGYQLGVFNGNGSNVSADTDNDKDVAMRVWYEPFKDLHVGGAFTWGHISRGLHDFKAEGSSTLILDFNSAVGFNDMDLLRYGFEFVYGIGPVRVTSEYMRADYNDVTITATGALNDFYVQGVYANLSWFLTGEEKRAKKGNFGRIKPNRNFNLKTGGIGAWELVAGYEWVDIDNEWFSRAGLIGTTGMDAFKAGINWYHNPMFRVTLDYVYNDYEEAIVAQDNGTRDNNEHMVWMRFALEF